MREDKTFLYLERNISPTFFRKTYVGNYTNFVEKVVNKEVEWFFSVYKRKNETKYHVRFSVQFVNASPETQSYVFTEEKDVVPVGDVSKLLFEDSKKSVFIYIGEASDEEAEELKLKWFLTMI